MVDLFIDTSNTDVSIALIKNDKLLDEMTNNTLGKHSVYAVRYIDELLKKNGITPREISKIYVVNGPGSFTGLRIGITIAKTYAFLCNICIIPISSLKLMALGTKGEKIMSLIDFKHGSYYMGVYDSSYNDIVKEGLYCEKEVTSYISKYNPIIIASSMINTSNIKANKYHLDINKIVSYYKNKESVHPHKLEINYLKKPQALEDKQ